MSSSKRARRRRYRRVQRAGRDAMNRVLKRMPEVAARFAASMKEVGGLLKEWSDKAVVFLRMSRPADPADYNRAATLSLSEWKGKRPESRPNPTDE